MAKRTQFDATRGVERSKAAGFSLIELLIVVAIILIIAAIAIPNLLRSKMAANETSAVSSMRALNTAEVAYASAYSAVGYSNDLPSLGGTSAACAVGGSATSAQACLVDQSLSTATSNAKTKSGYYFTYVLTATVGGINTAYTVSATPLAQGSTGQRYFYTDQTGVIRFNQSVVATVNDSPIQ